VRERLQPQVRDDPLRPYRRDVGPRRDPVAVPHRFRDGRPAEDVSTLKDEDVASGLGQVRGASETVVPAPDHDHVSLGRTHTTRTPSFHTCSIRSFSFSNSKGSPSTTTTSAILPGASDPSWSSRPISSAALE